ncbi:MAG TPA: hypothetical protein VMV92_08205 [Streptosporangiaceae bacterium]|nr:hypothetical protein [Streptosporangiaceae bacterium]
MTAAFELPALDGRHPLGFLAALGLIRALNADGIEPLRLSFSRHSAAACLHSRLASAEEIADTLQNVIFRSPGAAIPGIDPRFPFPAGRGSDPMRRPREEYAGLTDEVRAIDEQAATSWLPSLLTDLAIDSQGRADLTPFCAPSGKQNLRTFFDKPLAAVRSEPSRLREALTMWRRVDGFTGEYLDHHVLNSAADDPGGQPGAERGVPGATWLATMALPLLRIAGDGEQISAALWHRAGRRLVMIWPLWHQPLDLPAVQVMIEHPSLIPVDSRPTVRSGSWEALGIFAVYSAERQRITGRNFAGVLAPCPITVDPG